MLILFVMAAASPEVATNFGIRSAIRNVRTPIVVSQSEQDSAALRQPAADLALATKIGARYGRVTSTWRSAERNRLVGGVPNSWHLSGRAIDIVRSPSISHSSLANSLRQAGFFLIESLDEGDHSHFAFGSPGAFKPRAPGGGMTEVQREASYFTFRRAPLASR